MGDGDASQHSHRMHNGQIPVDTNTSEESNAAIQIQVETQSCYLAECVSKGPKIHEVVHHQKRERDQVQDVSKPQVEDEHVDIAQFRPFIHQTF